MQTRVLLLGASGYIGSALVPMLEANGNHVIGAGRCRRFTTNPAAWRCLDATDPHALHGTLAGMDVVVNAICGPPRTITRVAANLAAALRDHPRLRLVQLGSLAVFGQQEGTLDETTLPLPHQGHRYAAAHLRAEQLFFANAYISERCLLLRLGCVYGPGSPQWVDRLCRLLRAGRLGDLGPKGAGQAPLIHVRDATQAIAVALQRGDRFIHHLLAPEPPSWNRYFSLLAQGIGIAAPPPVTPSRLATEIWLRGPARAATAILTDRDPSRITQTMARLFASRARFASHGLLTQERPRATDLEAGVREAAAAFLATERSLNWLHHIPPGLPA